MGMHPDPKAKGITLRNALVGAEAILGASSVEAALERLDEPTRSALKYGSVVASSWYPLGWQTDLLAALADVAPTAGLGAFRRMGRLTIERDLRSVYRGVARLLGPERMLSMQPRFFHNYYDTGTVVVHENRRGFARVSWNGCTGFDERLVSLVHGSAERMLELLGAEDVRAHITPDRSVDVSEQFELVAFWK